ncbi:putative MFS-type transporter YybF [Propionispora sp. 2/2-37]|uniref:MFS transporter n=1 Tax=Propionispora sp. 2/2-37 TaxID=1677858 RepID=UPI0006BB6271|nr:MFS transporter [Propionispora sp. 2/2-37]CUH95745.1 putative MFS-type transporter YybF [Propionispora sp. 2/2-37]
MLDGLIEKGDAQYWKTIAALFLGSFATFALLYCMQPLIPVFSAVYHIPPASASLSISFATGSLAVAMLFMSWLSEAKGRKCVMAVSLLGSSVLAIAAAFSSNFALLLVIRILQGILLAGFPAIAMAYINEEFSPYITGLVMGIYVSGNSVGGLLGRIMISTLTDFFGWRFALGTLGFISVLASLWFWFSLPESRNFQPRPLRLKDTLAGVFGNLREAQLCCLYAVGFLIMGSFVTLYNYIAYPLMAPPYNLSQTIVGCIFVVYLVGTFSSTFMGKMADNVGSAKVLCLSLVIMLAGAVITLTMNIYIKVIGVAVFTFGFFGSHSVASSWVGKGRQTGKAQAASLYLLFYYIGSSILGAWGGKFLLWHGWKGVVLLIGLALSTALLVSVALWAREGQCTAGLQSYPAAHKKA